MKNGACTGESALGSDFDWRKKETVQELIRRSQDLYSEFHGLVFAEE